MIDYLPGESNEPSISWGWGRKSIHYQIILNLGDGILWMGLAVTSYGHYNLCRCTCLPQGALRITVGSPTSLPTVVLDGKRKRSKLGHL